MTAKNPLLLPSGLYDLLPPKARMESHATQCLLSCFESFGYAQVSPPLLEFEASLFSGRGQALASQTFRVMDPLSQEMMGFRADITLQVARIAGTRLASSPRPLRLCYAGPILQIKADALKSERQLMQAGIELIGSESENADAEAMIIAAHALEALGVADVSIDINLPGLLGELCPEAQSDEALRLKVKDSVMRRDSAGIAALPISNHRLLASLIDAAGPAEKTLIMLRESGIRQAESLEQVTARVQKICPQVSLTIDPVEYRGFDYHQGIGFSLFAKGLRHELGRGGRYQAAGESATGFTLSVTHLLRLLETQPEKKRILVPQDIPSETACALRKEGWATLLAMTDDLPAEARHLQVNAVWRANGILAV
jgi:ATP phosphoribosyltransferase regulatory subunit